METVLSLSLTTIQKFKATPISGEGFSHENLLWRWTSSEIDTYFTGQAFLQWHRDGSCKQHSTSAIDIRVEHLNGSGDKINRAYTPEYPDYDEHGGTCLAMRDITFQIFKGGQPTQYMELQVFVSVLNFLLSFLFLVGGFKREDFLILDTESL